MHTGFVIADWFAHDRLLATALVSPRANPVFWAASLIGLVIDTITHATMVGLVVIARARCRAWIAGFGSAVRGPARRPRCRLRRSAGSPAARRIQVKRTFGRAAPLASGPQQSRFLLAS
jgi:hypothetical protein